MRLKFGKHQGEDLTDVPIGYIKWLEEQHGIDSVLRRALNHEIQRREGDTTSLGRVVEDDFKWGIKE